MHNRFFSFQNLWIVLVLVASSAKAQYSEIFEKYKDKYPEASVVLLNQESNLFINVTNGIFDITQQNIQENLYLNEFATQRSQESISFSSFYELGAIEASSFNYDNNKYREEKVSTFTQKDELGEFFYDDIKSVNFIYSNLKKGSRSQLKYSQKIKNPRLLTPFYFGDFSPIAQNKFSITTDPSVNLKFKQFNTEGVKIDFTKQEKRGKIIYTWELKDVNAFDYESRSSTHRNVLPHIIPFIASYEVNGNTVPVLNETKDLYNWYYSMIKEVVHEPATPELVELTNSLIEGKENDLEKVKAIYYWTQLNIKYIAFEYALGGFIPRGANEVFEKKYGDCKDNSSILYKMLEIAGLKGHLTWIGTRKIPYSYEEVPTPVVDNHMILSYFDGEAIYYLDATGRNIPITFPTSFIQGKEALIAIDDKNYRIAKVPIIPAEKNFIKDITKLKIEGQLLTGSARAEFAGYAKIDYLYAMEGLNTKSKRDNFYNDIFEKGNNKFIAQNISEINREEYDQNLIITYNFSIGDYFKQFGDEIFINLNLNKYISQHRTDPKRKREIEVDYKNSYVFETELQIPDGYEIEFLPKSQNFENNYIKATIDYEQLDGKILYKHSVICDYLILDLDQQKEVNKLINDVEKAYKEVVTLTRSK
ncbi:transglutaminase-like domain-containing protein [Aequorivita ciconiae]|nr:transglutaminase-like domain-containing protein [Aequorivita sp. H23M31]